MALLDPSLLQCPACRAALESPVQCEACSSSFTTAGGLPVLIDFSDSIFTPEVYETTTATVLPRLQEGSVAGRFLARLTYGESKVTPANVSKFIGHLPKGGRVLVVGGGSIGSGMGQLYQCGLNLVGVDVYPSPSIALICDGHSLPFVDGSFDGVVIQAVLEHVLEPHRVVAEIHRVLRPNGLVYAETPFMQQVHEQAYDFTRFTHAGHRWLFRSFDEISSGSVLGPATTLQWSIAYFAKAIGAGPKVAALATAAFFWLRYLDRWTKKGWGLDTASGLFFMGRRVERPMAARDLPGYYAANR